MPTPDLNLLVTLDVLLAEGSVARAAHRLRLSPSAMSRRWRDCARRRAIRCWSGPDAASFPPPERLNSASRSVSSCRMRQRFYALRKSSTSDNWSVRSRCGPAKALWRTSDRASLRASARKLPARGCASCKSRDKDSPLRDGSVDLNWRCGQDDRSGSGFAIVSLASCEWGPAEPGRDHPRPLRGRPAHFGLAAGSRQGADR